MAQPVIADLVIRNIGELLTMKGVDEAVIAPEAGDLGIIKRAEVAVKDRKILYAGPKDGSSFVVGPQTMIIDAENKVVCPGFVDSHTHSVFAGTREEEFLMRMQGKSYAEIQAAGGGIVKTVRATRMASEEKLQEILKRNIFKLSRYGTTTAEIKSGYGLNTEEEIKLLRVIKEVALETDILIIPTLLGAHVVPPEYVSRRHKYVELVARDMVPMVHENHLATFVDVYVDESAFTPDEAREILKAARDQGMPRKLHADEMADDHGAELAAEMGCVSADHLIWTNEKGMKAMAKEGVIATLMPGTVLSLGHTKFADARAFIEHGVPVALATDYNPGTCMCPNMLLVMALGVLHMKMTAEEVMVAATINGAAAVGRAGDTGSLRPGKDADLLVLDIDTYRELPYRFGENFVRYVVAGGGVIKAPKVFKKKYLQEC
ncbi:MAG: imidazolonepropionase [Candidatus Cryosericum sp.]